VFIRSISKVYEKKKLETDCGQFRGHRQLFWIFLEQKGILYAEILYSFNILAIGPIFLKPFCIENYTVSFGYLRILML
jgi:hypothetical protein